MGQDFIREKFTVAGCIDDRARLGGPGRLSVYGVASLFKHIDKRELLSQ
jgi:hypothetical protein